ncbi:MAG TPA: hypothetical protein VFZ48_00125 [Candidatus Saccharimonadales bacterium]
MSQTAIVLSTSGATASLQVNEGVLTVTAGRTSTRIELNGQEVCSPLTTDEVRLAFGLTQPDFIGSKENQFIRHGGSLALGRTDTEPIYLRLDTAVQDAVRTVLDQHG